MTAHYVTDAIDFNTVSAPISGETKATVELVANDWRADEDWRVFENACRIVGRANGGEVDPNYVRDELTNQWGELCIDPNRYSAFYSPASRAKASRNHPDRVPFLDFDHWGENRDHKGRNAGKPAKYYRLRGWSA